MSNDPLKDIEDQQAGLDMGVTYARVFEGAYQESGSLLRAYMVTAAFVSGMMYPTKDEEPDE